MDLKELGLLFNFFEREKKIKITQMSWIATRNYLVYSALFKRRRAGGNKEVGSEANHIDEHTVVGYKVKLVWQRGK